MHDTQDKLDPVIHTMTMPITLPNNLSVSFRYEHCQFLG